MTDEAGAPRRLAESPGPSGDLLRNVLAEQQPNRPLPRFTQLQERRLGRTRRHTAALLAAAALALVVGLRSLSPSEPALTVHAEPVAQPLVAASTAPSAERVAEQPALSHAPTPSPTPRDAVNKQRAVPGVASSPRGVVVAPPPAVLPPSVEQSGGAKVCAEQARSGAVEQAIGCYEALSSGSGVTAELALFEQARLAGKALRQPSRALSLLDTYRQRFPNGSLRAEVMLARIEWSLAAGDTARARAGVEEALASGLLVERRAELERLRASLATH